MNVGVWPWGYQPEAGGGNTFETEVLEALAALAGESHHVFTVLSSTALEAGVPSVHQSGSLRIAVRRVGILQWVGDTLYGRSRIVRRVWKRPRHIDSILQDLGVEFVWFVGPMVQRVDLPYLLVVWDLQHRLQPWFPEVTGRGLWDHRESHFMVSLRRAATVIVGTETGKAEVERFYQVPSDRITVLPHPTPKFALSTTSHDDQAVLEKHGLHEGYLFYPAQFWPHKNHANLLLAAQRLREEGLDLSLVFTGSDQGNQAYVTRLVRDLDMTHRVHFLGFVPRRELAVLYRHALALTYVSFFGPENLPPLEAFTLGCPVIAANAPGVHEQLGDAAVLVDPKRPEDIARAIRALHREPALRHTLIERGRVRAGGWTAQDFVRGVFSILDGFEAVRRCWE